MHNQGDPNNMCMNISSNQVIHSDSQRAANEKMESALESQMVYGGVQQDYQLKKRPVVAYQRPFTAKLANMAVKRINRRGKSISRDVLGGDTSMGTTNVSTGLDQSDFLIIESSKK